MTWWIILEVIHMIARSFTLIWKRKAKWQVLIGRKKSCPKNSEKIAVCNVIYRISTCVLANTEVYMDYGRRLGRKFERGETVAVILARGFCCYPVLKWRRSNPGWLSFKRFSAVQLLPWFRLLLNSTGLWHHFDTKRIKIQPTEAKLSSTEKAVQTLLFCREGQFCLPLVNGGKAMALHRSQLKSSWTVP